MTGLAFEHTHAHTLFVVRYERCRSEAGVPKAHIPLAEAVVSDTAALPSFLIMGALDAFVPLAKLSHPDNPEMWMPSEDASDYTIEISRPRDVEPDDLPVPGMKFAEAADAVLHDRPR